VPLRHDRAVIAALGYDKHDPAGKDCGNSRNGKRSKTVLTDRASRC
jgi:hypothetical protein